MCKSNYCYLNLIRRHIDGHFCLSVQCDNPCGHGKQTRNMYCQVYGGKMKVDESYCAGLERPPVERECWDSRGSQCNPLWQESEYGEVSIIAPLGLIKRVGLIMFSGVDLNYKGLFVLIKYWGGWPMFYKHFFLSVVHWWLLWWPAATQINPVHGHLQRPINHIPRWVLCVTLQTWYQQNVSKVGLPRVDHIKLGAVHWPGATDKIGRVCRDGRSSQQSVLWATSPGGTYLRTPLTYPSPSLHGPGPGTLWNRDIFTVFK